VPKRRPKRAPPGPFGPIGWRAGAVLLPQPLPTRPRLRVASRQRTYADAVGPQKYCSLLPPEHTSPLVHQKAISPATPFASGPISLRASLSRRLSDRQRMGRTNKISLPQPLPLAAATNRLPLGRHYHSTSCSFPSLYAMDGLGSCSRPRPLEQRPQAHSSLSMIIARRHSAGSVSFPVVPFEGDPYGVAGSLA